MSGADNTAPVLQTISITASHSPARFGDVVTLTIVSNEALDSISAYADDTQLTAYATNADKTRFTLNATLGMLYRNLTVPTSLTPGAASESSFPVLVTGHFSPNCFT